MPSFQFSLYRLTTANGLSMRRNSAKIYRTGKHFDFFLLSTVPPVVKVGKFHEIREKFQLVWSASHRSSGIKLNTQGHTNRLR